MQADFWHDRWDNNKIGFHEPEANGLLVRHFGTLCPAPGSRVFVPLCGKTLDIAWLLTRGCHVAGAELSRHAITQLFAELGLTPEVSRTGDMEHYSAERLDIFIGDIFALSGKRLGKVDAVYDRAALVALPEETRGRYVEHIADITAGAPQLLITLDYDQSLMDGPPFSVSDEEVTRRYGSRYEATLIQRVPIAGGLKGVGVADEKAWSLRRT